MDRAAHALSIDEARAAFQPVLWEAKPNIQQVWFAGVHSNVGGGYPKQGMSLVTLDWMMEKAQAQGLRILADDRQNYWEHGNVDDKMYDSRAGLGVFYRWQPRDMQRLCEQQNAALPPSIHLSVLERIAHGTDGYAPGTLAPGAEIVFTPSHDPAQDDAVTVRAAAAKAAVDAAFSKSGSRLGKSPRHRRHRTRRLLPLCAFLSGSDPGGIGPPPDAGSRRNPWTLLERRPGTLLYDAVTAQWSPPVGCPRTPRHRSQTHPARCSPDSPSILRRTRPLRRSPNAAWFSRATWHDARQDLRNALKSAPDRTARREIKKGAAAATPLSSA